MKVLSITPTYYPGVGGIESVVRDLATQVGDAGVRMDVAHVSASHSTMSMSRTDGIDVYRVPVAGNRLVGYARGLGRLAEDYDLLHVHDPQLMMLTANVLLQCRKVPAVLSTHGGFRHTSRLRIFKWLHERLLMRPLLKHYAKVLAVSESDTEYFGRFSDNVLKCENGIAFAKFQAGRSAGTPDPTRWIYWGRWSRNKRIDALIDTVAQARANGIEIDLLIAGPDFDNIGDALKARIESLGIGHAVRLHPYIGDAELLEELRQRTVFITASEYEGFGVGVLEAMAAGKIVICRDMEPLNGFVDAGSNGLFLKFDQGAKDLETLRRLARLDAQACAAMATAAQATAGERDWAAVARKFSDQYVQALSRQQRHAASAST